MSVRPRPRSGSLSPGAAPPTSWVVMKTSSPRRSNATVIGTGAKSCACSIAFSHASLAAIVTAATSSGDAPASPSQRRSIRRRAPSASRSGESVKRALPPSVGSARTKSAVTSSSPLEGPRQLSTTRSRSASRPSRAAPAAPSRRRSPVSTPSPRRSTRPSVYRTIAAPGGKSTVVSGCTGRSLTPSGGVTPSSSDGVPWAGIWSGGGCPALTNRSRPWSGSMTA